MKAKALLVLIIASLLAVDLMLDGHQRLVSGQAPANLWSKQFGTTADDEVEAVATDGQGNAYVAGNTQGSLFSTNIGDDMFIIKYDANGNKLWGKQIGADQGVYPKSVVVDNQNNLYVSGVTDGKLFATNTGEGDVFVVKYDPNGTQLWAKQFGTSGDDCANGLAVDSVNDLYIVGFTDGDLFAANAGADASGATSDAFVVKFDANGTQLWGKQFGVQGDDDAWGVAVDGQGNVCVTGDTTGNLFSTGLGWYDAFVAKFDANGTQLWGKQFGTSNRDTAGPICVDTNNNIYIGGSINGTDTLDTEDGYLSKFDANGNLLWNRSLTTPNEDIVSGISINGEGNIVVAGTTKGSLFAPNAGDEDIFVAKYDTNGNILWDKQYGTSNADDVSDLCIDNQNNIYIAGYTDGDLFAANTGNSDAYIQKIGSSGQMAMVKQQSAHLAQIPVDVLGIHGIKSRKPLSKSLTFAWAGKKYSLNYPPLLIGNNPYMYVGYLCYGTSRAHLQSTQDKRFVVTGPSRNLSVKPGSRIYSMNGQTKQMAFKAVIVNNICYVPLDLLQTVLPVHIHYEEKTQQVRFEPLQIRQAHN